LSGLLSFTNTYVEVLTGGETSRRTKQGVLAMKGDTAVAPRRDSRGSFSRAVRGESGTDCLADSSANTPTERFREISAAHSTDEGGSQGGGGFIEREAASDYV
jgi:hypothetical protein